MTRDSFRQVVYSIQDKLLKDGRFRKEMSVSEREGDHEADYDFAFVSPRLAVHFSWQDFSGGEDEFRIGLGRCFSLDGKEAVYRINTAVFSESVALMRDFPKFMGDILVAFDELLARADFSVGLRCSFHDFGRWKDAEELYHGRCFCAWQEYDYGNRLVCMAVPVSVPVAGHMAFSFPVDKDGLKLWFFGSRESLDEVDEQFQYFFYSLDLVCRCAREERNGLPVDVGSLEDEERPDLPVYRPEEPEYIDEWAGYDGDWD